ncbi:MAG: 23S rRNA (guanosine(2251)-2'-O)-methyltransferase RlmB [Anaerolineae bacterium]
MAKGDSRSGEYLYGRQCVRETLVAGRRALKSLTFAEGLQPAPILRDIARLAEERGVPVSTAPKQRLVNISEQTQGVVLEVGAYPYADFDQTLASLSRQPSALVLVLDSLQDPQNFGTLLRTAEAVAVDLVVMPERRQVEVTAAVSHASVGAVEHLRVTQVVNLRRALQQMAQAGLFLCGLERTADSQVYTRANLTGAIAVVVGSEGEGLRRLTKETCDVLVEVPMRGHIGSLNAAVAGSLLLYEVLRQRG